MRLLLSLAMASAVLGVGYAATGQKSVWRLPKPKVQAYRPAPLASGDDLREAYRVRLNGQAMDLARFASRRPLTELLGLAGKDEVLVAHPDGFGGSIYWRSRGALAMESLRCGDCPGADPGGIRPPRARRLLAAASDRPDGLAAALYEADANAARFLSDRLAAEGWAALDLGAGLALWGRGRETLLLDAPGPGRPGVSLVYWRAPGGTR